MDDIFNDVDHYLSHHGILGMKWGKQNGPPYPLSDAKHDRIVKKAEKRRQRIMKDPKKLYKHQSEFSTDELQAALDKIRVAKQVQKEIPGKKKKQPKLKGNKKKWAKNPYSLSKHADRYSKEEFDLAKEQLYRKQYLFDQKMKSAEKPKQVMDLASGYLGSTTNIIGSAIKLKDKVTPYDPKKLTKEEQHWKWLYENGLGFLASSKNAAYNFKALAGKDINEFWKALPDSVRRKVEKEAIKEANKDRKNKRYRVVKKSSESSSNSTPDVDDVWTTLFRQHNISDAVKTPMSKAEAAYEYENFSQGGADWSMTSEYGNFKWDDLPTSMQEEIIKEYSSK